MTTKTIKVPDIGGADGVEVIEICVAVGDQISAEQSLVVLESDKASMEIPSPMAGKVVAIKLSEGASVAEGDDILELEITGQAGDEVAEPAPAQAEPEAPVEAEQSAQPASAAPAENAVEMITLPDVGSSDAVEVIEICVAAGDEISEGDSLVVVESDKASMEIPAPKAGKVLSIAVKEGDKVVQGTALLELQTAAAVSAAPAPAQPAPKAQPAEPSSAAAPSQAPAAPAPRSEPMPKPVGDDIYAGPAVRKLARELGVDLLKVNGSGPKGRVLKEDVQDFVKKALSRSEIAAGSGAGIAPIPAVDFAKFGEIEMIPLSKMDKLTAANMQRSWLNVPHVTQFGDADITDLESFRASLKQEAERRGVKLTPLPFLLKACAAALKAHPKLCSSLHHDGEHLVRKHYVHIGMAVDTPAGLLVPVIKDVDQKSIWDLAAESAVMAQKAKDRKLTPAEMQGGCFSISSLGNIGGAGFTPIVNAPEVAILGVSKLDVKPVWNGSEFVPRKMLPLSLSYDHRVINGADAGRFFTDLTGLLADIRLLVL